MVTGEDGKICLSFFSKQLKGFVKEDEVSFPTKMREPDVSFVPTKPEDKHHYAIVDEHSSYEVVKISKDEPSKYKIVSGERNDDYISSS